MRKKKLLVKKLVPDAKLPTKAYSDDAGFDLYALNDVEYHKQDGLIEIHTGIAIAIPKGYYGQVACRSGMGRRGWRVHPGVIDSGYRGEISVFMQYHGSENHISIHKGDKIAQLLILPVPDIETVESNELPTSERGEKGFGSSGR
jgi:dUTP pyrophosphatase